MGFLKKLLDPRHHYKDIAKKTKQLAHGDIKGMLTEGGIGAASLIRRMSSPKTPPAEAASTYGTEFDPSQYFGDESDAAFGSFSDPFSVEDFYEQQDPGYAFELQQGTQALQNAASAGSGAFSGASLKDLLGYSQSFARTGYNDAFNRHQVQQGNIFGRLRDIATLGQNAAAGVGTQGTSLAGNAGQFLSNAGTAAGGGIVGAPGGL